MRIEISTLAAALFCATTIPAAGQPEHSCGVTCEQRAAPPLQTVRGLDAARPRGEGLRGQGGLEDGSIIDLLVLYTTLAADANGGPLGIESMILDGRDELNDAMAASLVETQFRVVHMEEVAFNQSGSMGTQLASLRDPGDGVLDIAHDLRDEHKADIVLLVVSTGDVCGIAYIGVGPGNTPTPENAFGVVAAACMTAPVSAFAHEVGHVMGLLHGYEENPCTNGGTRFGKGYQAPDESFMTVMAVGNAPRALLFSNPAVEFAGQPAGVAVGDDSAADSAAALALAAPVVANYRSRDLNANGIEDSAEIDAGTLDDCDGNGYPDFADRDFNRNGIPDACDIASGTSADANGNGVPDEAEAPRLYVNAASSGAGTGVSWEDAITDLQEALSLARASGEVDEIWIAEGLYLPAADGHRARRFELVSGVSLYGGFAGTETALDQRVGGAHPTVLSGDLNQDDLPDPNTEAGRASRQDNTINVLFLYQEPEPITLDGLIIEHGCADFEVNCGAFMYTAGGMVGFGGDVTITNCEFRNNSAVNTGALILVNDVRSRIISSRFRSNAAIDGLFYGATYPTAGALPYDGYIGAVRINTFHDGIDNQFVGNLVEFNSDNSSISGVLFTACRPLFANNVLARNTSASLYSGAALAFVLCEGAEISNSTIALNTAPNNVGSRAVGLASNRSQIVVNNTIIYGNTSGTIADERAQFSQSGAGVDVVFNHSIVQGWTGTYAGLHTDGGDPLFADPGSGDFSLLSGSAAIDRGDNALVPADGPDLDGDDDTAEPLPFDFAGALRFVDDPGTPDSGTGTAPIVDVGAFEFQAQAPCPADLAEPFGLLDLADLVAFVNGFMAQDPIADLDGNGLYDLSDVTGFVSSFLAGCP